jgi:hypothetical protein
MVEFVFELHLKNALPQLRKKVRVPHTIRTGSCSHTSCVASDKSRARKGITMLERLIHLRYRPAANVKTVRNLLAALQEVHSRTPLYSRPISGAVRE